MRVVGECVGVNIAGHRLAGRLVGHPAPDQDTPLQRDIEIHGFQSGRFGRYPKGRLGVRQTVARLEEQAIGRPLGQAGKSIVPLGVGRRLDARRPDEAVLVEDHAAEFEPGDGPAGVLVADDALDRLGRRGGVLESAGVVDGPFRRHRVLWLVVLIGVAVAVHGVELGRGDRRPGDDQTRRSGRGRSRQGGIARRCRWWQ